MKLFPIVAVIVMSSQVFATEYQNTSSYANSISESNATSGSISDSRSNSSSMATGGTGGNGGASSLSSTINVSSSTVSPPRNSRIETVGIAPDIVSYSTAPCRVAIGASGGWLGGAFGFTGSVLDEGCDIWRDHVNLHSAGHKSAADVRLCDKPELRKLLSFCGEEDKSVVVNNTFIH